MYGLISSTGRAAEAERRHSKGQPLFRLDSPRQQAAPRTRSPSAIAGVDARIVTAKAKIAAAEGQVQQAKGDYEQAVDELTPFRHPSSPYAQSALLATSSCRRSSETLLILGTSR